MYHEALRAPSSLRVTSYSRQPSQLECIFYRQVIDRLAARRRAVGLTQEQLDQELGVSEGQVAKWESLARLPGAFMFMCWSGRLGLILNVEHTPTEQASLSGQLQ